MSLFNLKDIRYIKNDTRNFTQVSKRYDSNVYRYPIDVGNTDKGHYMMIHINVQQKSRFQANIDEQNVPSIFKSPNRTGGPNNVGGYFENVVGSLISGGSNVISRAAQEVQFDGASKTTQTIYNLSETTRKFATGAEKLLPDTFKDIIRGSASSVSSLNNVNFLRTIKRTTDSIALYMPSTLAYTHNQQYNQLEMAGENAAFFGAQASILADAFNGKLTAEDVGRNLTPFLAQAVSGLVSGILGQNSTQAIFTGVTGLVQNPLMELIYSRPEFRTFRFDFMFNPRSEIEAKQVYDIIERLKFHQAPEVAQGTAGYFLVPPSEFDIEFYYNGIENPNIPKISTCVLRSIDVDYAPGGFQAYEIPGEDYPSPGRTGSPVSIRMSLSFQETEIVTKGDLQGNRSALERAQTEIGPG